VAAVAQAAAARAAYALGNDRLGRWVFPPAVGLRLPVYAAASQAALRLADPRRLMVRACPSDRCGWLFLDHTGLRKWCSTATCGQLC
jgi:predicted RNA-binding Zn ribbon-like protein